MTWDECNPECECGSEYGTRLLRCTSTSCARAPCYIEGSCHSNVEKSSIDLVMKCPFDKDAGWITFECTDDAHTVIDDDYNEAEYRCTAAYCIGGCMLVVKYDRGMDLPDDIRVLCMGTLGCTGRCFRKTAVYEKK